MEWVKYIIGMKYYWLISNCFSFFCFRLSLLFAFILSLFFLYFFCCCIIASLVAWRRGRRLVLGVAPGMPRLLAWQPWHLETSTFVSLGRRGTSWHLPSLCVASVALRDIYLHFAWQAWHLWHWAGSGGALGFRRGAGDAAALGVAGVALCDIYLHFVWQAWHFVTWIVTLRGRRGTYGTGLALVARLVLGVAPGTPRLLAWHFVTSTFTLCGKRGTSWHLPSLCVAGVALMALGWLWWRAWF